MNSPYSGLRAGSELSMPLVLRGLTDLTVNWWEIENSQRPSGPGDLCRYTWLPTGPDSFGGQGKFRGAKRHCSHKLDGRGGLISEGGGGGWDVVSPCKRVMHGAYPWCGACHAESESRRFRMSESYCTAGSGWSHGKSRFVSKPRLCSGVCSSAADSRARLEVIVWLCPAVGTTFPTSVLKHHPALLVRWWRVWPDQDEWGPRKLAGVQFPLHGAGSQSPVAPSHVWWMQGWMQPSPCACL